MRYGGKPGGAAGYHGLQCPAGGVDGPVSGRDRREAEPYGLRYGELVRGTEGASLHAEGRVPGDVLPVVQFACAYHGAG